MQISMRLDVEYQINALILFELFIRVIGLYYKAIVYECAYQMPPADCRDHNFHK